MLLRITFLHNHTAHDDNNDNRFGVFPAIRCKCAFGRGALTSTMRFVMLRTDGDI